MPRRNLNIQYCSAIVLLAFLSLPVIDVLVSLLNGSPYGMITKNFNNTTIGNAFEALLLIAVVTHIFAALRLSSGGNEHKIPSWQWLRLFAGFYLSVFLFIHLAAVMSARFIFKLATGFYSGAEGMNTCPLQIVFMVYGALLAVFFGAKLSSPSYRQSFASSFSIGGMKAGLLLISITTVSFAVASGYNCEPFHHKATSSSVKVCLEERSGSNCADLKKEGRALTWFAIHPDRTFVS